MPIVMYQGQTQFDEDDQSDRRKMYDLAMSGPYNCIGFHIPEIEGYRSDTVTQISRLYASCLDLSEDSYLMTGDVDMMPLSDYWKNVTNKITVYGHDLTGFTHYPICYIGAPVGHWDEVMKIDHTAKCNDFIKRDLDTLPQAKDPDFYKYWFSDQDLITQRLKEHGTGNIDFINRGQYSNGYAKGRVDRGSWTLQHDQFIDCHMHRDLFKAFYSDPNPAHVVKWQQTMDMLNKCFPGEDFTWLLEFTKQYATLAYGK
jgi:hypothetical protein